MKLKPTSAGRLRFLVAGGILVCLCACQAPAQQYAVNAVGYMDVNLVVGFNLVANPLDAEDNSISNLFQTVPDGSLFVPWDKFLQNYGPTNRFVAGIGWVPGSAQLLGGEGAFLWVPRATRVTFAGEPWWYSLSSCTTFPVGATISSIWPLLGCGMFCDPNPCVAVLPEGMTVFKWNPATQSYLEGAVFLSGLGWLPEEPRLAPAEAALFQSPEVFRVRSPAAGWPIAAVRLVNPRHGGTNFQAQFWAEGSVSYSLQRTTNLESRQWMTVLTQTGPPGGGWVTVTDPAPTNAACFYRLDCLRLLNPSRNGASFSFQFHAEDGVSYQVSRKSSLADLAWVPVLTIPAPPGGGLVTATDLTATNAAGYYRVGY